MSRASEWRAKGKRTAAAEMVLPSGATVLARRPAPGQLAMWGSVPASLAQSLAGQRPGEIDTEEALRLANFMRELLVWCVVEPEISEHPTDDQIHPRDIPSEDMWHILRWAMRAGEARALEGFRGESEVPGCGGDGAGVRAEAEQPAGN